MMSEETDSEEGAVCCNNKACVDVFLCLSLLFCTFHEDLTNSRHYGWNK